MIFNQSIFDEIHNKKAGNKTRFFIMILGS